MPALLILVLPLIIACIIGKDLRKPDTGYLDNDFND